MANFIKIKNVAEQLSISRRQVERFMASGKLPRPIKQGSRSFLLASDVETYIKQREQERQR